MKSISFYLIAVLLFLSSCVSIKKNIDRSGIMFQRGMDSLGTVEKRPAIIHPYDKLSIEFYTQATPNQEQAALFNVLTKVGYEVDEKGFITIPVIGKFMIAGLTTAQAEDSLQKRVSIYVSNPLVIVNSPVITVTVMGENKRMGNIELPVQQANLVNLMATVGVTDNASIKDILVIREDSITGKRIPYQVDMRSGAVYQSPVYHLQKNDVIYTRVSDRYLYDQSTAMINKNLTRIQPFMMLLSLSVTLLTIPLIIKAFK